MYTPKRIALRPLLFVTSLVVVATLGVLPNSPPLDASSAASSGRPSLQDAFRRAAHEFGVPESVLLSVSYHLSLWEDHNGAPSTSGAYGPMALTHVNQIVEYDARDGGFIRRASHDPGLHTLDLAAKLLREKGATLQRDPVQNIRGGAALLARYEIETTGKLQAQPADWYGAVARYSGSQYAPAARSFADAVYSSIRSGVQRTTQSGQHVVLDAQDVTPDRQTAWQVHLQHVAQTLADCPPSLACQFVPAAYHANSVNDPTDYGNYNAADRPSDGLAIHYIVIHDTEATYDKTIATFQNPTDYGSANYVIQSATGLVTEMVPNRDIAWHAGNYYVNIHAIGIEHEGVAIQGATWYTEQVYETSAALVRYLAAKYHVPLSRAHIFGHDQVPGETAAVQSSQHWDPGPYWNWQRYMQLLGAPLPPPSPSAATSSTPSIVTIDPAFSPNQPIVTYCNGSSCSTVAKQPANFVYLRTAPSAQAPLVGDPALHASATGGTTQAPDWGDKAVTGERFVLVGRQGSWDAIDYGGQQVWLYDPVQRPVTSLASGRIITPQGQRAIPVYGCACPERSDYPSFDKHPEPVSPLEYTILPGQYYVATNIVKADYYWSPTMWQHAVIKGTTRYYQIFFNHRLAFVRVSDVRAMSVLAPTPTPSATPSPTPNVTPSLTPISTGVPPAGATPTATVVPVPEPAGG